MNTNNPAKYAFFYMLSLVALVFTSVSVGIVIFQGINKNIPDIIRYNAGSFDSGALKFAISALIIAVPIYFVMQWLINKSLFRGELTKDSAVRRWLSYFILLVSSIVMIVWLIFTINSFLDGELTVKFALKALTAIGISAIIFSYYLYDIRREKLEGEKDKVVTIYFYGSLAVILASFVFALFNVESPRETRLRKLDEMVLNQFDQITWAMQLYYRDHKALPQSLSELQDNIDFKVSDGIVDPETKQPFEYRIIDVEKYELCANFRLSNKDGDDLGYQQPKDRWPHEAGRACFENEVKETDPTKPTPEIRPLPVE